MQDSIKGKEISQETWISGDTSVKADSTLSVSKDSLIRDMVPDTIYTGIIDTFDYFLGQHNVRLFKTDFQAICDSLVYSVTDSVFQLFGMPYMWSDSSQIAGDTIDITLKDKKMDRLKVKNNATILSTQDYIFFNQIQGRFMDGFFDQNKLKQLDVDGNAQVLYYLTDENKAYLGINKTEASRISFEFDDNNVISIRNYVEPRSKVLPMKSTNHDQIKIKGFLWNAALRPQNAQDL
jgi:lipopolysaccharide export system protein LptA